MIYNHHNQINKLYLHPLVDQLRVNNISGIINHQIY